MLILPSLDQQQLKDIKLRASSVGLERITSVPYVLVFGFPSNGNTILIPLGYVTITNDEGVFKVSSHLECQKST